MKNLNESCASSKNANETATANQLHSVKMYWFNGRIKEKYSFIFNCENKEVAKVFMKKLIQNAAWVDDDCNENTIVKREPSIEDFKYNYSLEYKNGTIIRIHIETSPIYTLDNMNVFFPKETVS